VLLADETAKWKTVVREADIRLRDIAAPLAPIQNLQE